MNQQKQLFKPILESIDKKQIVNTNQQQAAKADKAKMLAIGFFFLIGSPMILKAMWKSQYVDLVIGLYWIIVIGSGLFFGAAFVKKRFFTK